MDRKELLNGVGKMLVTYGNGIINSLIKDGIDPETEECIIAFRQRVREINEVNNNLIHHLKRQYGNKYIQDIKTIEGSTLMLETAVNHFIDNKNIYVIIHINQDAIIFDFFFTSNTDYDDIQNRQIEYLDAKRYLVLKDLEVLTMGTYKWYDADENYRNDSRLCRIRMDRGSDYLSRWFKEKVMATSNDYFSYQLELILL